jgi:hypothetical protein
VTFDIGTANLQNMRAEPVIMDPGQVRSLNEQVDRLGPGDYLAVLADGRVFVRATSGLPGTLVQMWRRNPAMMIPDSAGYRPETREADLGDL